MLTEPELSRDWRSIRRPESQSAQDFAVCLWPLRPKTLDCAAAFFKICDESQSLCFIAGKLPELVKLQLYEIVLHGLLVVFVGTRPFSGTYVGHTCIEERALWWGHMTCPGPNLWEIGGNFEKPQVPQNTVELDFAFVSAITTLWTRGGTRKSRLCGCRETCTVLLTAFLMFYN